MTDLVRENVQSHPRPPDMEPVLHRITIWLGGMIVAETTRAQRVLETHDAPSYYLPPEDIVATLRPTPGSSFCEWKGVARYYDVLSDDKIAPRAAWACDQPTAGFAGLGGYIAFYAAQMDEAWSATPASFRSRAIFTAVGSRQIWRAGSKVRQGRSIGRQPQV